MIATILFIIIGAAINFGIGMLYYQQLGSEWSKAYGINMSEMKPEPEHFIQAAGVSLAISLGLCYLVNGFDANTIWSGAVLGLFSWLFLIVPTQYSGVIWAKRPFKGFLIDIGAVGIGFIVLGAFFGLVH